MATLTNGAEPYWVDPLYSWPDYSIPGEYGGAWDGARDDKWRNERFIRKERGISFKEMIIEEDMEFFQVLKALVDSGYLN